MPQRRALVSALAPIGIGLAVGSLTSLVQASADFPWLALVNAVSPWLTTAFAAGALQRKLPAATVAGLVATLLQVVGYYATAELRGFGVNLAWVAMWAVCAIVGGPVFGAAGHAWRRGAPAGLGAAALVAAWASEAVIGYQIRLGYTSSAVLFGLIAVVLALVLGRHRAQYARMAAWLVPALLAGAAGHAVLGVVAG